MKMNLSDFVQATRLEPPEPDGAWAWLRGSMDARRRARARRRFIGIPLAAVAAAAAVALVWNGRTAPETTIGTGGSFESTTNEVALALPDGVKVDLGAHSRVSVEQVTASEIRVGLGRGHARFDVEPRHKRRFVVDVENVEVRVVGTRFEVSRVAGGQGEGARIEVSVEHGIVEVRNRRGDGEPRRLRAGERFSALLSPGSGPVEAAEAAADEEQALAEPEDETSGEASTDDRPPRRAAGARHEAIAHRAPAAAREEARQLLDRAQRHWRAGRMADAATLYEEILSRFPGDPRAGLAALELGRIRMDHLGDLPGAVASLERAVRSAPGASFHEDALARLVQADARLGRATDCRRARDAYRSRYPNGIHAATVSGACDRGAQTSAP